MVTLARIRKAMDSYKAGRRPPNLGVVRSWYIVDDRNGEMYPLKAIWALANNVPAKSFKTNVAVSRIRGLQLGLSLVQNLRPAGEDSFQTAIKRSVDDAPEARRKRLAAAPAVPNSYWAPVRMFVRNPDVVAEALYRANGKCGSCGSAAPFNRSSDGSPFLEVHHIKPLARGGEDTVANAVALCPNCHRKEHHG